MRSDILPGAQICSPIIEMGISTEQLEHLIVGRKFDIRVVDAILAFHCLVGIVVGLLGIESDSFSCTCCR